MGHEWEINSLGNLDWRCKHCGEALVPKKNYYGIDCPLRLPKGAIELLAWDPIGPMFAECECGAEKVGSPRHSDYCPKYQK